MQGKHNGAGESKDGLYSCLEAYARQEIQGWLQDLLEQEVTDFLGREKSQRKVVADAPSGYRNGYGQPRRVTLSLGTIEVRRPRIRNVEERFVSRVLPLFRRQSREVRELLPELYLHGLASGDFELALRGLLGAGAPLSASSLQRLKEKWALEYEQWQGTPIEEKQVAYLWADGIYVKAGLGKEKTALLVVIGAMQDGSKRVLAVEVGYRESKDSWAAVLRQLKHRGLSTVRLMVGDGHLGLWAAVAEVFPEAGEQLCWNHKILNVLDALPKPMQVKAKPQLRAMMYAETREQAVRERKHFETTFRPYPKAVRTVVEHWGRLTQYYHFPREHWKHLRTSNIVESPFSRVRLRTGASRRFKSAGNATCLIWKTLMVAEKNFRKLNAPHIVAQVAKGHRKTEGVDSPNERVAA
ncbi:MAG: IS256 family transposase [Nitrospirales bacterium]|nr:MAG: IS256 family transposase [Nitrospirales bacterium]